MKCIVSICGNDAIHNIGIRLRRPDTSAIWAPDTNAFVCNDHAVQGLTIQIVLTPNESGEIETVVSSPGGDPVIRTTPIIREA